MLKLVEPRGYLGWLLGRLLGTVAGIVLETIVKAVGFGTVLEMNGERRSVFGAGPWRALASIAAHFTRCTILLRFHVLNRQQDHERNRPQNSNKSQHHPSSKAAIVARRIGVSTPNRS